MSEDTSPSEARAALAAASESAAAVRASARWMAMYLLVFGLGFAALTLMLGLLEPRTLRVAALCVAWPAIVGLMVWWSRRRPAALRETGRRTRPFWVATIVLYAIALAVGTPRLIGEPRFWVPAAVLVALPMVVGAVRERRA
jgi:hypothetical protein